ncbi:MAG: transposase [bacterium]|nr:transposase [bacterium]
MPKRLDPFFTGGLCHLFDKTVDSQQVFRHLTMRTHFLDLIRYYRSSEAQISYSDSLKLKPDLQDELLFKINLKKYFQVEVVAFSIMKNHYHILVKQLKENGINSMMSRLLNSFTKYYNVKYERKGPIFLPQFRAVPVTTDEQFIHTTRYIHRNHLEAGALSSPEELIKSPWTSLKEYVENPKSRISSDKLVLDMFDGSISKYLDFVFQQDNEGMISKDIKNTCDWLI